ncbi:MAG: hypothetical protein NXH88_10375 [Hyphomonas sp.]|nr:hypothetical protein [Hyphomonas sp.]
MTHDRLVVMALAARYGRVGYVVIVDGMPIEWQLSKRASQDTERASNRLADWINEHGPNAIVVEDHRSADRKSDKTRSILAALQQTAKSSVAMTVTIAREQHHPNRYAEAAHYARRFPNLAPWLPKRPRPWKREPHNLVYFEALALAEQAGFLPAEQ